MSNLNIYIYIYIYVIFIFKLDKYMYLYIIYIFCKITQLSAGKYYLTILEFVFKSICIIIVYNSTSCSTRSYQLVAVMCQ